MYDAERSSYFEIFLEAANSAAAPPEAAETLLVLLLLLLLLLLFLFFNALGSKGSRGLETKKK